VWQRLEPRLFARGAPSDVVSRARELALEQGAARLAAATAAIRDREDSTPLLREIDVPVLVVVGEEDQIVSAGDVETMADALRDARLVRIAGAGHLPPLERPAELNAALLDFLDQLE
ncbi:MAG: alpha/beta hydrolase, partial [Actinomycetota bacterium]|nr:alpha/beta hydrolase [Actinomycetota bacterium]